MGSKRKVARPSQNLAAFMRAKLRKECVICQLPAEVREQLGRTASRRSFTRQDQLDWLHEAIGAKQITMTQLVAHLNGRHDEEV